MQEEGDTGDECHAHCFLLQAIEHLHKHRGSSRPEHMSCSETPTQTTCCGIPPGRIPIFHPVSF